MAVQEEAWGIMTAQGKAWDYGCGCMYGADIVAKHIFAMCLTVQVRSCP